MRAWSCVRAYGSARLREGVKVGWQSVRACVREGGLGEVGGEGPKVVVGDECEEAGEEM